MPEALYFTEDEAANRLLADDPFALLVGFALDQQVTVQQAFLGPLRLKERLGTLEPAAVATADLEPLFREKPAIHRFPGSMAGGGGAGAPPPGGGGDGGRPPPPLDGGSGRHRPAPPHRRAAGLRRDEGESARLGARKALRRACRAGPRARPSHARGRRLGPGARR